MIADQATDRVIRDRLASLCHRAIDVRLSLEELLAELPGEYRQDEYYTTVRNDLVDGVEHVPAKNWGKMTDYEQWERTEMYSTLILHIVLLGSSLATPALLRIYREISPQLPADVPWVRRIASDRLLASEKVPPPTA